jgi:hypothetical protein
LRPRPWARAFAGRHSGCERAAARLCASESVAIFFLRPSTVRSRYCGAGVGARAVYAFRHCVCVVSCGVVWCGVHVHVCHVGWGVCFVFMFIKSCVQTEN